MADKLQQILWVIDGRTKKVFSEDLLLDDLLLEDLLLEDRDQLGWSGTGIKRAQVCTGMK